MMSERFEGLARTIRQELSDLDAAVAAAGDALAQADRFPDLGQRLAESAALNVQGAYTVVEEVLRQIAATVDEYEPAGGDWHQALLRQVARDAGSVRPAVLGEPTLRGLRRLLAFRHVVRAAYGERLDGAGVRENVERLRAVHPLLRADLLAFADWLDEAAS